MAQLHRFVKLHDRFDSQVFTFIVPPTVTTDLSTDIYSRDFVYGHQRWCICLVPYDKAVGAYLTLKNVSAGMTCSIDFSFTMVNKEHFSKNESIIEKNVEFTAEKPTHGRKTFIGISDLNNRQFRHKNDCFLLELELRSIKTFFEQWLQLPRDGKDHHQRACGEQPKFETNYFTFGNFDWNLCVYPWGDCPQNEDESLVYLTRQTSFDHRCRTRYRITLGSGDRLMDSDVIEQILDTSGTGPPYHVGYHVFSLTSGKARLRIKVQLLSVSAISEVIMCPFSRNKNRVHLYDRDKQAWMLEADVLGKKNLVLKMYYSDIHNVPRKFSRYVCWSTQVVPVRGHSKPLTAVEAPYSNYYAQTDHDEGYTMKTDIPVSDLNGADSIWMDAEDRRIVVQIEWLDSHLLFHSSYHKLDDTVSCHKHQQWREIMALQAENYALEKQLHSYQVSIARMDNAKSSPAAESKAIVPNGRVPPNGSSDTGSAKSDALREMSRRWESGK